MRFRLDAIDGMSGMTVAAFVYATKFHLIEAQTRAASSIPLVSNLFSSLRFFVDKCVVCLVVDITLTFRGNRQPPTG